MNSLGRVAHVVERKKEVMGEGGRKGGEAVESKFAFLWAARSGTEKGGRGESHFKRG